jgi:hypothetical protein
MPRSRESYRRGYQHGAWDVLSTVIPLLTPREQDALLSWYSEVQSWRHTDMRGATAPLVFQAEAQTLRDKLPRLIQPAN